MTTAQVTELVERRVKASGRRLDVSTPLVDAILPEGHRLHVVLEGISRGFSAVNIVDMGSLSPQAAAFFDATVRAGLTSWSRAGRKPGANRTFKMIYRKSPPNWSGRSIISDSSCSATWSSQ